MQMYTGTRLTTEIHRRLFSRFFSEGGGTSVHRLEKPREALMVKRRVEPGQRLHDRSPA